jgi:hypothetical protein
VSQKFYLTSEKLAYLTLGLGLVALFAPSNSGPPFAPFDRLCDALHVPLFAVIAIATHWLVSAGRPLKPKSWFISAPTLILTVVGVEIIQPYVGRSASIVDICNGLAGTTVGLCGIYLCSSTQLNWKLAIVLLAFFLSFFFALLPAWDEWESYIWQKNTFPILADFGSSHSDNLWKPYAIGTKTSSPAYRRVKLSNNVFALELELPKAEWAGVEYLANQMDWSGFDELLINIHNKGQPIPLSIRLDDTGESSSYLSRFSTKRMLEHGANSVVIPFSEIESFPFERPFSLKGVHYLRLYVHSSALPASLQLQSVELLKSGTT